MCGRGGRPEARAGAYAVCLAGKQAGLSAVVSGAGGRAVDTVGGEGTGDRGFGAALGNGLGHGVGLLVHEAPRLSQESEDELAAGHVVTVEPGIYLTGRGGIRIEDLVVVGEEGPEVLTSFTKELVTVG